MSGYIGNIPVPQATQSREVFTATSGQTTFATVGYPVGFVDVWLNGVKLVAGTDFTATNGSDVVLTVGAATGDTVEVISNSTFEVNSQTFTGTTKFADGSASAPSITNTGDENTGVFFPAADTVGLATAGSERARIDASGNLLVGTTDTNPVANNIDSGVQFGDGRIRASRVDRAVLELNRKTSDGSIAEFRKDGTTVGSIGSYAGHLRLGSGSANLLCVNAQGFLPSNSDGTASDGSLNLGVSDRRFKDLYLSGGVYLGGTGAANLLDDYEEGTWTPTNASNITINSILNASYTKIGRTVTVIAWLKVTQSASTFQISGLPFTAAGRSNASISELANILNNPAQVSGTTIFGYGANTAGSGKDFVLTATYDT